MEWLKGMPFVMAAIALACGARSLDPSHDAGGAVPDGTINIGADGPGDAMPVDAAIRIPVDAVIRPLPPLCGNGVLDPGEQCDDGNRTPGDGCSAICQIVCYWECGTCGPPGPCAVPSLCGDGLLAPSEACDDGNAAGADGCASDCSTVELGWFCPVPGRRCVPICGDHIVVGPESCDDGNTNPGDGCSEICLAEPNAAACGDGVISGAEACDDGAGNVADADAYGSCTSACRFGGYCGDGVRNGPEDCDLGQGRNTSSYGNRDGCGPRCTF